MMTALTRGVLYGLGLCAPIWLAALWLTRCVVLLGIVLGASSAAAQVPRAIAQPAVVSSSLYRASTVALIAAQTGDVGSSLWMNRCANITESNPYAANADGSFNLTKAIALKAAVTIPALWAMHVLKAEGHPRVAAVVGLLSAAQPAYLTAHNLSLPCEGRR